MESASFLISMVCTYLGPLIHLILSVPDTIKDTCVANPKVCIENTFFYPFRTISEMSELYRNWQKMYDAQFHYVSSSPFHLWKYLDTFLSDNSFPKVR